MDQLQQPQGEESPVSALSGVGPKLEQALAKLGIVQIKDLLFHLPYRYQDRTSSVPIGSIASGESVLITGAIVEVEESTQYGRRTLTVDIADDSGSMRMRLFHYSQRQRDWLRRAKWIRCYGEVRVTRSGVEMIHPEFTPFDYPPAPPKDQRLTPIYGLTEGISQAQMRKLVTSALRYFDNREIPELLPQATLRKYQFPGLKESLREVHTPPVEFRRLDMSNVLPEAIRRLIVEELVSFQIARRQQKRLRQMATAPAMQPTSDLSKRLRDSLSFEPTKSQIEVIRQIISDLRQSTPMLRLVQGDVGSGKTLVAAAAAAWVVDSKFQVAVMAPTELLAEQHLKTFYEWFAPLGVEVVLLTGKATATVRRQVERKMKSQQSIVAVGTHALFQEGVEFGNLGLIVIDEQHRFGVDQRFALREKGVANDKVPHQLVMTATPIPRTLAMTFYSDLDVSSITELPPGRIAVNTQIYGSDKRKYVIDQVDKLCSRGQQAYWVCPIIEKSEVLDVESAVEAEKYVKQMLPERRVALIHGRVKVDRRDKIMNDFRNGKIDILVATTVIEVGVDVPNAGMMVIESAERLGLAQLHQLRGRVGRGAQQANCILVYRGNLSEMARKRLKAIRETTDGFKIAEQDLLLRGAGELLGTRQTGAQIFRIAEFPRDRDLLEDVIETADLMLDQNHELIDRIVHRWTPREGQYSAV